MNISFLFLPDSIWLAIFRYLTTNEQHQIMCFSKCTRLNDLLLNILIHNIHEFEPFFYKYMFEISDLEIMRSLVDHFSERFRLTQSSLTRIHRTSSLYCLMILECSRSIHKTLSCSLTSNSTADSETACDLKRY